ncbi:NAD(P)H-dependent oxidoreductase [Pectobacterium polaris]|uniref:NAD(P)H-dependent oxidoreductase n=1 Tax=Pectobacterium polaris TaxID=2042057 RepID=A0AAW4NWD3_9GAMM|nr:NAD(P)H-dependent oxidoreductase [Pectobacterium polaris]MBW5891449.1 NAD(P)H-dependent oxidoreductase [Pectobacterium polaris]
MNTLVIVSHPYASQSRVIKMLQQTVEARNDTVVRNLESLYGNTISEFDVVAEQAASEDADRIVFMYPTHWFNLTPNLKAYLNEVWTYGWAFGPGGEALKGKEMLVVTTAGASEHLYSHDGLIDGTMDDVLTPMKASALYVGMKYVEPLAFFEVTQADKETLLDFQTKLSARLQF